jgi:quinoprotein dehydrogenase-associated probable ABC transporter substrate-binding protein
MAAIRSDEEPVMYMAPVLPRQSAKIGGVPLALAILLGATVADGETGGGWQGPLRICADPNNMPFSNANEDGFENRLAALIGTALGQNVSYLWSAQHRGFIRRTLKAGECDVLIGVPKRLDMVETTRPYYRSTYVFVSRTDRHLDITSIRDPRLRSLKIGVQLVGDDGFNTPPAHVIAAQGMTANVTGYTLYGDYGTANPPARIITAIENGDIDIAAVWGPLAGYFGRRSNIDLTVTPIENTDEFAPLTFEFDIAMGVRKGDHALRDQLDEFIARDQTAITEMLRAYGVPLVNTRVSPSSP